MWFAALLRFSTNTKRAKVPLPSVVKKKLNIFTSGRGSIWVCLKIKTPSMLFLTSQSRMVPTS